MACLALHLSVPSPLPYPLPPSLPPPHLERDEKHDNKLVVESPRIPGVAEMGVGLRRGGVMGEPEVNEIIGKVRCEFVTEV